MVYRRKNEKEKSLFFLATRTPALQSTQDGLAPGEWETTPFRCDVRSLGLSPTSCLIIPAPFTRNPSPPLECSRMAKTSVLVIATPTRLAPGLHEGGVHACSPHAGAEYGAFNWEPQLHRQLAVDLRATYSISTCFLSYKMDTTKGLSYSPAFAPPFLCSWRTDGFLFGRKGG